MSAKTTRVKITINVGMQTKEAADALGDMLIHDILNGTGSVKPIGIITKIQGGEITVHTEIIDKSDEIQFNDGMD